MMTITEYTRPYGVSFVETTVGVVLVETEEGGSVLMSMLEAVQEGYAKRLDDGSLVHYSTDYEVDLDKIEALFLYRYLSSGEGKIICLHPVRLGFDLLHFKTLAREMGLDEELFDFKRRRCLSFEEWDALLSIFKISPPDEE